MSLISIGFIIAFIYLFFEGRMGQAVTCLSLAIVFGLCSIFWTKWYKLDPKGKRNQILAILGTIILAIGIGFGVMQGLETIEIGTGKYEKIAEIKEQRDKNDIMNLHIKKYMEDGEISIAEYYDFMGKYTRLDKIERKADAKKELSEE